MKLFRKIYNLWLLYSTAFKNVKYLSKEYHDSTLGAYVKIYGHCYLSNVRVGDYTYVSINSNISNAIIGKFCSIGPNFICGWGTHPTNGISTSPMFYSTAKQNGISLTDVNKIEEVKKTVIGNDVFIGANVTIIDGVKIGNGAVIGACSIVTKDVPPYTIVAGNPAKFIKLRFPENIINKLEEIKWWDWNANRLSEIEENYFDITRFVEKNYSFNEK